MMMCLFLFSDGSSATHHHRDFQDLFDERETDRQTDRQTDRRRLMCLLVGGGGGRGLGRVRKRGHRRRSN